MSVNITNNGNLNRTFAVFGTNNFGGNSNIIIIPEGANSFTLSGGESRLVNYSCTVDVTSSSGIFKDSLQIIDVDSNSDPEYIPINITLDIGNLPPEILESNLSASRVDMNFEPAYITARARDYSQVVSVWANVTYTGEGGGVVKLSMSKINGTYQDGYWRTSFTPNRTDDYIIVVYAKDDKDAITNSSQLLLQSAKMADINIDTNISSINVYNITQTSGNSFLVNVSITGSDDEDEGGGYFTNQTVIFSDSP